MNQHTLAPTSEQARLYIKRFSEYTLPGAEFVDFADGRIHFDNMTDAEAIRVCLGLMDLEAEAHAVSAPRRKN